MGNSVENSSNWSEADRTREPDVIGESVPPAGAFVFAAAVVLCSLLVLAIAVFEITESRGWRLAPVFLERMLR